MSADLADPTARSPSEQLTEKYIQFIENNEKQKAERGARDENPIRYYSLCIPYRSTTGNPQDPYDSDCSNHADDNQYGTMRTYDEHSKTTKVKQPLQRGDCCGH